MSRSFSTSRVAALTVLTAALGLPGAWTGVQAVEASTAKPAAAWVMPEVSEAALRAHLALLASDLFEGRGTGQRGGELTVAYLEAQAQVLGLKPVAGGPYRQAVKLLGARTLAESSVLKVLGPEGRGAAGTFEFGRDWVFGAANGQPVNDIQAELVFAGYGVTAPEERWDDFKGVDVKGKVLVVLANDPQPTADEPGRFGGAAMTIYGRRGYKYEEALRRGARGVLVLHTDASAQSSWAVASQGALGEQFQLDRPGAGLAMQGWISEAAASRLFAAAGQDLAALRAQAETRTFKPVPLGLALQGEVRSAIRRIEQFNVAGVVPGTDPVLKEELVIYSAHWDHLGSRVTPSGQTEIFNGAVDNASGTAALLAMAQQAVRQPARRTQMFLWVCAEEQGLLGSGGYAQQPLWPLGRTAAALNLDTLNFVGQTLDIGASGAERSSLGETVKAVAAQMGLSVAPPRVDTGGFFFRSDHYSFAKAGVPAFSVSSGSQYVDPSPERAARRKGYGQRYHQTSDRYDPAWDLSGMRQQAQFTLELGRAIADAPSMPVWREGDPFGAVKR